LEPLFTEDAFYVASRCLPLDCQQPRQKDSLAWQEMRERCSFRFCDLSLIAAQFFSMAAYVMIPSSNKLTSMACAMKPSLLRINCTRCVQEKPNLLHWVPEKLERNL
jgi:hypothetical protein